VLDATPPLQVSGDFLAELATEVETSTNMRACIRIAPRQTLVFTLWNMHTTASISKSYTRLDHKPGGFFPSAHVNKY